MLLLNFSHPITPEQLTSIHTITSQNNSSTNSEHHIDIRNIRAQFNVQQPFAPQIAALVDSCGLDATTWQTAPILINPPGYAPATVTLLADFADLLPLITI